MNVPRVVRNDWSAIPVAPLADWQPTMTVSVIIPAHEDQATLDLTLAALSQQTYPADLLEVIVVDDGSEPALRLPERRPANTTLLRVAQGWGKSNALQLGVAHSRGQILHLLDADMLLYPEHVAAQARWHHAVPYAATLATKRFVDPAVHQPWPSAEQVAQAWTDGAPEALFGGSAGEPHDYQERYIAQTDELRTADHLAFRIFVGMSVALRRELYDAAGGPARVMRFGNDTEFGYRLAQVGAVFVPEPQARAWHLGPTHVMLAQEQIARYRLALIANLVPIPRHWRRTGGTTWSVPLVEVVLPVGDEPLERVRTCVDAILRGTERDVRVVLLGPWDRLANGRVPALTDPQLEPRLIAATYRGEPRVRLLTRAPESSFPAPYRLELPQPYELGPRTVADLVDLADRHQAGMVSVTVPEGPPAVLYRTAALGRARWVRFSAEPLADVVAAVYGHRTASAEEVGIGGVPAGRRGRRLVPSTVEVEGVRSLARAAVVVAWLGGRRAGAWLRRAGRDKTKRGKTNGRFSA